MRILIATGLYPPEIGGPATYAKLLNDELPHRGIEVAVLKFGDVRNLPPIVRHAAFLLKLLREGRGADLIYAQDAVSVGFPAALAARLLRRPLWLRVPGDHAWEQGVQRFGVKETLDEFARKNDYSWRVRLLRALERFAARSAGRIIVPSEYMKRIVGMWGIPAERIEVIYSAVTAGAFDVEKEAARRRLGLDGSVIVSAGRLVPWKGFRGLIDACAALAHKPTLVIIGDGPEREALEGHARARFLSERVRFTGQLPRRELFAYLSAADVFALNTAYEGLSHQLIEALALGVPIVTTRAGGNPELITDGENGLLVAYNDIAALTEAIGRLLSDEHLRAKLAQKGKERAAAFSGVDAVGALVAALQRARLL